MCLVLVMLGALVTVGGGLGCNFPAFMQTKNTQRDWRSYIKEQYTEFTLQVEVVDNQLKAVATDSSMSSYAWVCMNDLPNNRFLVGYEEIGHQTTSLYSCVEFVQRSDNVVQVRNSSVSRRLNPALCDSMELNPWLLVDKTHVAQDKQACALSGGFSVRIFDKMYGQGVCDAYHGETRLESECLEGEGLYFYFRSQSCVPQGLYMYATQRTVCLANWQEGPHTFMLMRHDTRTEFIWLFRYPTALTGDSFMAYLMKDLVADSSSPVAMTQNYLRLDMVRDVPRPVAGLCVDDYEMCSQYQDPCASVQNALTCIRTCGLCNATRPNVCAFPINWQGMWYDGSNLDATAITTDQSSITVHGKVEERFYCLDWDRTPPPDASDKYTSDQMLVADFHNGCRPRYTCARVTQHSSGVMFLKMSQTRRWPFTQSTSQPIDCAHFTYDHEQVFLDNRYRNKNSRVLYAKQRGTEVTCNMPNIIRNYTADFAGSGECPDTSITETPNKKAIEVVLTNCPNRLPATTFTCRESVRLNPSKYLLIVTEAEGKGELYCWLFPKRSRTSFYLLKGNQCNDALRKRLRVDRLDYLVTFSNPKRKMRVGSGSTPSDTTDDESSMEDDTDYELSDESKQWPEVKGRTKPPMYSDNKTVVGVGAESEEEEGSSAGPYVVIAAVLIFALFQIPCLCKSAS